MTNAPDTTDAPTEMIGIDRVSFSYGSEDAAESLGSMVLGLEDVSLRVSPGECVLLCGPSGCGKSTLLRLINGLVPNFHPGALTGDVTVAGINAPASPLDVTGRRVSTVFQNPRTQFFTSEVRGELAFGPENFGMAPDTIRARLVEAAQRTGIDDLLEANLFRLSGGQKQLVACACAMVVEPKVHLFDEPTSNLSAESVSLLRSVLSDLHASGATMVIAEHRLSYLRGIVDRVVLLDGGGIVREMPAERLWSMSEQERTDLGLRSLYPVTPMRLAVVLHDGATDDAGTGEEGPGTSTSDGPADAPSSPGGLELENLRFSYGSHRVLDIPHLRLPRGRVTALVGPNRARHSPRTPVRVGPARASRGLPRAGPRPAGGSRRVVGYVVMQDVHRQLFAADVREELTLGVPADQLDDDRIEQILAQHGLAEVVGRHPMSLSGGQKQRLVIAAAQMVDKEVYVFDEPSSGLDYRHLRSTARTIRDLAESGKVVVVVTHDEELLDACADRVVQMHPLAPA